MTDELPPFAQTSPDAIARAMEALAAGGLVIVPTETVYGLAADATNETAVQSIFDAKGRPDFNPLIIHVAGVDMAKRYGIMDKNAQRLAATFWPGPLTLVVPNHEKTTIAPSVTAGLTTIAIRQPQGPMAELAAHLDRPLAAPSANRSGRVSATKLSHILADFNNTVVFALDDGPCAIGLESTIAKTEDDQITILRPGAITAEAIGIACPGIPVVEAKDNSDIQAPGMMVSHYAPIASVTLNRQTPGDGHAYLAFGAMPEAKGAVFQLSASRNLDEAAARLYAGLHHLDGLKPSCIDVAPIPNHGIGIAINDRLRRAAAPRQ